MVLLVLFAEPTIRAHTAGMWKRVSAWWRKQTTPPDDPLPVLALGLAGSLTLAEAVVVGLVAGVVVRSDWLLSGDWLWWLAVLVAVFALSKRKIERYIDDTLLGGAHNEDEHIKQLLREVLDERDTVG
jgi:hypothetical protein